MLKTDSVIRLKRTQRVPISQWLGTKVVLSLLEIFFATVLESTEAMADREPVPSNHLLQVAILDLFVDATGSVQAEIDIRSNFPC